MKKLVLLMVLLCGSVIFGQDEITLTNDTIIEMSNVGIPASVIITKIKNSAVKFNTDPPALKALTEAKVPADVISAMIERSSVIVKETEIKEPIPQPTVVEISRIPSPPFTPYRQLSKEEQKERMKNAAQVAIAAPMDKVSQLLIRAFQSWNYQLEDESSRSLVFTRAVKSSGAEFLAGMTGNNNVRHKIQVSMSEVSGISNVIVNMSVSMDNQYGKTTNQRINKKDDRADLDDLLLTVKQAAENQQ